MRPGPHERRAAARRRGGGGRVRSGRGVRVVRGGRGRGGDGSARLRFAHSRPPPSLHVTTHGIRIRRSIQRAERSAGRLGGDGPASSIRVDRGARTLTHRFGALPVNPLIALTPTISRPAGRARVALGAARRVVRHRIGAGIAGSVAEDQKHAPPCRDDHPDQRDDDEHAEDAGDRAPCGDRQEHRRWVTRDPAMGARARLNGSPSLPDGARSSRGRSVDRSGSSRPSTTSATRPAPGRASGRAPGRAGARRRRRPGRSAG